MKVFLPKIYSAGSACIIVAFLDFFGCFKLSQFLAPCRTYQLIRRILAGTGMEKNGTLSKNVCENILILGTHFSYLVLE